MTMMAGTGRVAMVSILVLLVVMIIMMKIGGKDITLLETITEEPSVTKAYSRGTVLRPSGLGTCDREGPPTASITVNVSTPVTTVDERFVSVGATMGFISHPLGQHFNSTRLWTLARGLSPALYRLGGAEADFADFTEDNTNVNCTLYDTSQKRKQQLKHYGKLSFNNITVCAHTWDSINEFTRSVGWDVLYTFNALHRYGSIWDPSQALHILNYTKQRGYNVLWSLGNEPNGFPRKDHINITAPQMARAFHTLRRLVGQNPKLKDVFLIGPDTSAPAKDPKMLSDSAEYLNEFLQGVGNATNATSFHFYYTSGRSAGFTELTDPNLADLLATNIRLVQQSVQRYGNVSNSRIWVTESGVCFGSGPQGLNNVYVMGMLFLDKLGLSARLGIHLIVHQGLIGKHGGLFNESHYPHMKYWLLLYHKRLMGTRVLDVSKVVSTYSSEQKYDNSTDFSKYVRVYAHCTRTSPSYPPGAITLMIINMIPFADVHIQLEGALLNATVHEYLFLPIGIEGLLSKNLMLNGQPLQLDNDFTLPDYPPRETPRTSTIVVPPQSYGFYVLPHLRAHACL